MPEAPLPLQRLQRELGSTSHLSRCALFGGEALPPLVEYCALGHSARAEAWHFALQSALKSFNIFIRLRSFAGWKQSKEAHMQ